MRWSSCLILVWAVSCGLQQAVDDGAEPGAVASRALTNGADPAEGAAVPAAPSRLQANVASRAELLERLAPHLSRAGEGIVPVELPGGGVSYPITAGFRHAMLAVQSADGSTEYVCVDSIDGAERALRERGHEGVAP
jgi:hypothetical protein